MKEEIYTYKIPNNPYIQKGRIYTLYINNNTNLDLSSIINIQNSKKEQSNNIIISEKDYKKLLELNNIIYQLTNKRT